MPVVSMNSLAWPLLEASLYEIPDEFTDFARHAIGPRAVLAKSVQKYRTPSTPRGTKVVPPPW